MFFLIPTGTDAPLYHWPFATGGMILVNIVVLCLQFLVPDLTDWLALQYGTFNPLTWFTSICAHAGIGHLIGNTIGIGLFGWIVEGKIGWWRFLLVYFGIGASACGVEQTLMLFADEGSSLGASGVVYGLIAMALLWAPENEVRMTFVGVFFLRPILGNFNISVSTLAFCMIGLEFIIAAFTSFQMSSAVLHLMGTVPGFLVAFLMIKYRRVDCDGNDLLSILKGKRGKRVVTVAEEKQIKHRREEAKQEHQSVLESGLAMVAKYIDGGHYDLALKRFEMLRKKDHSLVLTEAQYVTIIKAYESDESTKTKAIPLIQTYLQHYQKFKTPFSLILARTYVLIQDRPRQGLKVLQTIDPTSLNPKQADFVRRLDARARKMIADGVLEIDE